MGSEFKSLFDLLRAIPDEQAAIDHFTAIRWRSGKFCPLCGSTRLIHTFSDRRTHKCGDCRRRFSIKVGTIFQDTKIPLQKWLMAVWMLTSHKKGIASTTLARDIDVTQKTAWFMLHRLRHAAVTESFNHPLSGEVEVDETYVGGKNRNRHRGDPKNLRGTAGKAAVIGALSRDGGIVAAVIENTDTETLDGFVHAFVQPGSMVSTDEHSGYRHLGRTYKHGVVRHGLGEYVNGAFHTNGIEGYWSLLKRQIIGIHHWVSHKHLPRYVSEMAWRFNRRDQLDGVRVNQLLACANGRRLPYAELIA